MARSRARCRVEGQQLVDALGTARVSGLIGKPQSRERLVARPIACRPAARRPRPRHRRRSAAAASRDRRVELAQRAGGGIARVGEDLAAGGLLPRVQRGEIRVRHVDLAAHLEHVRAAFRPLSCVGDLRDGAHVRRSRPRLRCRRRASRPATRRPPLVAERDRQAVDLRLGREARSRRPCRSSRKRRTRSTNSVTSSSSKALSSDSIGTRCRTLPKRLAGLRADAPRRAVGAHELGKARLDRRVAAAQRIVLGIGDLGRILLIVELVVVSDDGGEPLQLVLGLGLTEIGDGGSARVLSLSHRLRHRRVRSSTRAAAKSNSRHSGSGRTGKCSRSPFEICVQPAIPEIVPPSQRTRSAADPILWIWIPCVAATTK